VRLTDKEEDLERMDVSGTGLQQINSPRTVISIIESSLPDCII
jgi:hypothetical protein